jgi:hypothetical protein
VLNVADDYFFAISEDPDCRLPCWQGLRVGESEESDVLQRFDDVFGYLSFSPAPLGTGLGFYSLPEDGFRPVGYYWDFDDGYFDALAVVEDGSGTIRTLVFNNSARLGNGEVTFHTPQAILRALGEPAAIHAEFLETAPTAPVAGLGRVFIVYDQGIAFFLVMSYDVMEYDTFQFCLGQQPTMERIMIFEPYSGADDELDELQRAILRRTYYPTVEEIFGLSPADLTRIARTEDNACLTFG